MIVGTCSGLVGHTLGVIATDGKMRHREFLAQAQKIQHVISSRADFSELSIAEDSSGFAYLCGELQSEDAKHELRHLLIQQGGEQWADQCLSIAVSVRPEKK